MDILCLLLWLLHLKQMAHLHTCFASLPCTCLGHLAATHMGGKRGTSPAFPTTHHPLTYQPILTPTQPHHPHHPQGDCARDGPRLPHHPHATTFYPYHPRTLGGVAGGLNQVVGPECRRRDDMIPSLPYRRQQPGTNGTTPPAPAPFPTPPFGLCVSCRGWCLLACRQTASKRWRLPGTAASRTSAERHADAPCLARYASETTIHLLVQPAWRQLSTPSFSRLPATRCWRGADLLEQHDTLPFTVYMAFMGGTARDSILYTSWTMCWIMTCFMAWCCAQAFLVHFCCPPSPPCGMGFH